MLLAAGREVVSKTSAYNITKLSYRVEVRVSSRLAIIKSVELFTWLRQQNYKDKQSVLTTW